MARRLMSILSIDPGGTTGIALLVNGTEFSTCVTKVMEEVWNMANSDGVDTIIIERFATSDYLSTHGLHTIEIVGGIKAIAHMREIKLVVHQPQNRVSFQDIAHDYLTAKNTPFMIHEEDALAHLMYYLRSGK